MVFDELFKVNNIRVFSILKRYDIIKKATRLGMAFFNYIKYII